MVDTKRKLSCILPDEIFDAILLRLPIRDAARTSILSRNWKFKWETMSKLAFNNECLPASTDKDNRINKLVNIVDSVLTLHVGTVQRFELSTDLPVCSDATRWISFLSRNNISELILRFGEGAQCILSSRVFSCEGLKHLELHQCVFKIPSSFQQFAKLATLKLSDLHDSEGRLEGLISVCPSLRVLFLVRIEGLTHLSIVSGNLIEVYVENVGCSFAFAPYLAKATFNFTLDDDKCKTSDLVSGFPNIRNLVLHGFAIESFYSYGTTLLRLPTRYDNLHSLLVEVDFSSAKEYMTLLGLIGSFPNLAVLTIEVFWPTDVTTNSWEPGNYDLSLNRLKTVKIVSIIGAAQELQLIAYFLLNASLLETIWLRAHPSTSIIDQNRIFKNLMRHRRASTRAEIIYIELEL